MISCIVDFKENLNKSIPYCNLLLRQACGAESSFRNADTRIYEHAAFYASAGCDLVSRICEGYQFVIAFCGELSHTEELKRELDDCGYRFTDGSDAELAVYAYIHFGENSPSRFFGDFSYIIYDSMRRRIFVAADVLASMPLFFATYGNTTVISSNANGVLAHPDARAEMSAEGISHLISVPRRLSTEIFRNIHMLPPSHFLKINRSVSECEHYTAPTAHSPREIRADGDISMFYSGSDSDHRLLSSLADTCNKSNRRIAVLSGGFSGLSEACQAEQKIIPTDRESILFGLEKTVEACAFPILSASDFLLPIALERLCDKSETLFAPFPAFDDNCRDYLPLLIRNEMLCQPVLKAMHFEEPKHEITLNSPQLIAQRADIPIKTPFCGTISASAPPSAPVVTALKHILLTVISKDSSPILAFYRRPALLRLCEGGFNFADSSLSEHELISYIIKLNIWLEKYRPILR